MVNTTRALRLLLLGPILPLSELEEVEGEGGVVSTEILDRILP